MVRGLNRELRWGNEASFQITLPVIRGHDLVLRAGKHVSYQALPAAGLRRGQLGGTAPLVQALKTQTAPPVQAPDSFLKPLQLLWQQCQWHQ